MCMFNNVVPEKKKKKKKNEILRVIHTLARNIDLLPSPRATPGTSSALRARGWGIV